MSQVHMRARSVCARDVSAAPRVVRVVETALILALFPWSGHGIPRYYYIKALSSALAVAIAQHVSPASSQPSSTTTQSPTPSNSTGNGLAASGSTPAEQ